MQLVCTLLVISFPVDRVVDDSANLNDLLNCPCFGSVSDPREIVLYVYSIPVHTCPYLSTACLLRRENLRKGPASKARNCFFLRLISRTTDLDCDRPQILGHKLDVYWPDTPFGRLIAGCLFQLFVWCWLSGHKRTRTGLMRRE